MQEEMLFSVKNFAKRDEKYTTERPPLTSFINHKVTRSCTKFFNPALCDFAVQKKINRKGDVLKGLSRRHCEF
jgi:hypothetical protein